MIAIVDYGMGNIHSVQKALHVCGARTIVTNNGREITKAKKVVLPGVGAFRDAMRALRQQKLIPALNTHISSGKPFLGICLGMQLLFEKSEEAPGMNGLGVIPGTVKRFPRRAGFKVPHMGWNILSIQAKDCALLKGIKNNSAVYFCHSYYPSPRRAATNAAVCSYGFDFTCIIWEKNVYGIQFHPEKSQDIGMAMINNFVKRC